MSTRESIDWGNDAAATPDWHVDRRAGWCTACCVPVYTCGCPVAEAELDRLRAQHWDGMGLE